MNAAIARVTAIGRTIDLRDRSNRYVVVASAVAGTLAGLVALLAGDGVAGAASAGAAAGLAAFTAWAVAREVDPDDSATAGIAVPLAIGALLIGQPYLAAVFAVLLAARIAGRTTGLALKPIDGVLVVGLAAYVATTPYGLIAAGGLAVAAGLDAGLEGAERWRRWLPAGVLVVGALAAVTAGEWPGWTTPGIGAIVLVLAAGPGIAAIPRGTPISTCDHTGEPLDPGRLRAARIITIFIALTYAVTGGGDSVAGVAPVFAALAAAGPAAALTRRRRSGTRHSAAASAGQSA
jgi:hypothetical protein